jgi:anti-sigma B factor antagonist
MNWTEQTGPKMHVIKLTGDVDLQHSPKLRQLLDLKVSQKVPVVLLDFSEVRYIDSSGLATLVQYYKNSRSYSGRLAVGGLSNRVNSIFELVRLSEIFEIYPSLADAEKALGTQA